jgi:hypothetical protein
MHLRTNSAAACSARQVRTAAPSLAHHPDQWTTRFLLEMCKVGKARRSVHREIGEVGGMLRSRLQG